MSEPRTEAGRRLLTYVRRDGVVPADVAQETILAIEAEASSSDELRAALDVDRLAKAEYQVDQGNEFETLDDARRWAVEVAREYAALAPKPSSSADPEGSAEPE